MKKFWITLGLLLTALLVSLQADTGKEHKDQYQTATVVTVEKHQAESNDAGGSPTDAPLMADDYSYDIGIRVNCNVYVGRYESPTDYLPSIFSPNHSVDVRLSKHVMYVSLPNSDREVKMGIVHQTHLKEAVCPANS